MEEIEKKIKYLRFFYLISLPPSYFHSARGYLSVKSTCSDRWKRTFTVKLIVLRVDITYYYRRAREKMIVLVQRFDQNWSEFWLGILMITERERERERERSSELGVKLNLAWLSMPRSQDNPVQCCPQSFGFSLE